MTVLIYCDVLQNLYKGYKTMMVVLKGYIPRNYDLERFHEPLSRYYSVPRANALRLIHFLVKNSIDFKIVVKDKIDVDWLRRFKFPADCVIYEGEVDERELNKFNFVIKSDFNCNKILLIKDGVSEEKVSSIKEVIESLNKELGTF